MKTIRELLCQTEQFLINNKIEDASFEAREIVMFVTGIDRASFSLQTDTLAASDAEVRIERLLRERVLGIPLQYLLGEWDFYGNTFSVFPGVLIPRSETEELTDLAIAYIKSNSCKTVYDVCAGTGCIGLSVAIACPETEVYLFELYEKPLQCIEKNAVSCGLKNVHIVACDVLHPSDNDFPSADVIISNPPYIPTVEVKSLQREVLQEPLTALDGGVDGLDFYRAICKYWFNKLNKDGRIFFECAENQASDIVELFRSRYDMIDDAYGMKDFYGLDRFVCIQKKG